MMALIQVVLVLALLPFPGKEWVVETVKQPVPAVRGIVVDPSGAAVGGVVVEVFDHPEVRLMSGPDAEKPIKQHKLAELKTGADGKFSFPELRAGKYELRFTEETVFNPLSVIVTLRPKRVKHPWDGIVAKLPIAT